MKNFIKKNYLVVLLVLLTIFYFEYSVSITWDSAHYLGYVKIFERILPLSSWDIVRGPIFPLIIYFGNVLFSKTSHGLLMTTYFYYLLMLVFLFKMLTYSLDKVNIKKRVKDIIKWVFLVLVIINPAIYGYYHCLLTEFVAITLAVISCYFASLWLSTDYYKDRKKYLLINLLFIILTVFSWFLKQPYVSCGFFALFVSYVISIFQYRNKKQFIVRTITILSCVICLFASIKIWNYILDSNGNDTSSTRNPSNSLGNQLINAVDFLEINNNKTIFDVDFINLSKLSDKEKEEVLDIIDKEGKYVLVYKYNKKQKIYDVDYIKSTNGKTVSTFSSVLYIMKTFINNPVKLTKSYVTNYFSIIDIFSTSTVDGVGYVSTKTFDLHFSNELTVIGNKPYIMGESNLFPLSDELYDNAKNYLSYNYAPRYLNSFMMFLSRINVLFFKFMFLLLPLLLIASVVMRIVRGFKKYSKQLSIVIILFGFSFLHILLHTVTGAIIDRYVIPALITTFWGVVLFVLTIAFRKKNV